MIQTILITGANRGIGLAITKLALIKKLRVEACCRDLKNSIELKKLSDEYTDLNIVEMDVKSSKSCNYQPSLLSVNELTKSKGSLLIGEYGISSKSVSVSS